MSPGSVSAGQYRPGAATGNMRLYLLISLLVPFILGRRTGGHYSSSNGYSGTSSSSSHHSTNSASHSYPHSDGLSGSGTNQNGLSGSGTHHLSGSGTHHDGLSSSGAHPSHQNSPRYGSGSKTEIHTHYHYSPPQQIVYGSGYHPVYHGTPPVYVYEYRDSGSRFDMLLTGLALYNLGRISAHSHDQYRNYDSTREYSGTPGEICKLGISKPNGEYEETRIDCKMISSFILKVGSTQGGHNVTSKTVSTTVTNTTKVVNGSGNGDNSTVITVTTKVENVTDALAVKGPSIAVTPGMTCYMIRISYSHASNIRENVECGLLQEYARRSLQPNGSARIKSVMTIALSFVTIYFLMLF